ncbi:MAG: hypothetical protein AAGH88_03690 [Planctomycetota bacterium]
MPHDAGTISTQDSASGQPEPGAAEPTVITQDMLRQGDPPTGWWGEKYRRFETWLTRKSNESNGWHRLLAKLFLPLAYRSGIKLGQQTDDGYEAVVPFTSFNKNWYNAMAGAALLANSEVAGGMYIFNQVGPDYTVVCKELQYKFRLPCLGPAIYRVKPVDDIEELKRHKLEFNVTVEMQVVQAVRHKDQKERKVGKATATFHVAPKAKLRARQALVQQPPPARLGFGLVWPAFLALAGVVTTTVLLVGDASALRWVLLGLGVLSLFVFSKLAWGYLLQHRRLQRWVALFGVVVWMFGLVGLGTWAIIAGSMGWGMTAGVAAISLLISAAMITWPIGRGKAE